MDGWGVLVLIAGLWLAIGLVLSLVMARRGFDGFGWLVLGTLLGPLALILAVDANLHRDEAREAPASAVPQPHEGVDVLVGMDGSPEAVAALDTVRHLFGPRLGRLTLATVIPFDGGREVERLAVAALERRVSGSQEPAPALEVLHGRPSDANRRRAAEGGFDLIAVGASGSGLTKTLVGRTASELSRDSKVPVLVVGGDGSSGQGGAS